MGVVSQSDRKNYEAEQSLWGYGAGVGLQLMRNLSLQYYYALAGRDVKDPLGVASDFAERGDSNHHIEFTLAY